MEELDSRYDVYTEPEDATGLIRRTIAITNPSQHERRWEAEFLFDSGAIDTVVPGSWLDAIGVVRESPQRYVMADGRVSELDTGTARVEYAGRGVGVTVVFADENVIPLLGATAMESLGLELDMSNQELKQLPAIQL